MSSRKTRLSVFEYLEIGLIYVQTALITFLVLFNALLRGELGHRDFMTDVSFATTKARYKRLSARQLQSLYDPTDEVYLALARAKGFQPATTSLALGAKAHWIGNENADKILIFFHGGGYVKPATTQFELLWHVKQSLTSDFAICILSYSLSPSASYPIQLQQAVHLLQHLVHGVGKSPQKILVCGDSAGGNLVLALLSHLLHPHPDITPLSLPTPLLGAAMISPWGDFRTLASSYTRNAFKDSIDATVLQKWGAYFMNGAEADCYSQPFRARENWWNDLPEIAKHVLVTAGNDEVLVDDITAFATKIQKVHRNTTIVIAPNEVHDEPFTEPIVNGEVQSQQGNMLKAWLKARIIDI